MITRSIDDFLARAAAIAPDTAAALPRAVFLVAPDGFALAEQSAQDNAYMAQAGAFDAQAASREHRTLHAAVSTVVPAVCFAGRQDTPDALFPNNVFGTAPGRVVIGRMRHAVRRREAGRDDIRRCFGDVFGCREIDLSDQPHPCELTGALVIDRARRIGWCGLSERCDAEGARLMHEAFGLQATLMFELAPGEYHTNVVLAVLAGRAAVVCPAGFADPAVPAAVAAVYGPHTVVCSAAEHAAFVGNCIALSADTVWMSARAEAALSADHRQQLAAAGFDVRSVPLQAIEAAGGSLRCCIGEVF